MRPWVLLLAIANVPMIVSTIGANLDIFTILLLVLAWLWRDKRWASAVMLGLALASKQRAWFYLPFYLILTFPALRLQKITVLSPEVLGLPLTCRLSSGTRTLLLPSSLPYQTQCIRIGYWHRQFKRDAFA